MMLSLRLRFRVALQVLLLCSTVLICPSQLALATDYFLTIGGGYKPSGNQASLEANVVFFQQILDEKHAGSRHHEIYFADGDDAAADLQVLAPTTPLPATELLASLHRREEAERLEYRNHRVPQVAGATDPSLVRSSLEAIAKRTQAGDRLIVYVTAHGSEGRKGDVYNTSIDCWNEKKISAREFTNWLNNLPSSMPVLMVMAQCYCGGFGHTIFNELDEAKGLAPQIRAGFFAQQHNLPAAGCRPDISNDAEFSSYFWGAIVGRSRTGTPIEGCDIDHNGVVSFAEAYAHAVIDSPTIDIPLTTSEVLLRTYSRKGTAAVQGASPQPEAKPDPATSTSEPEKTSDADSKPTTPPGGRDQPQQDLASMTGTLQIFADQGRPASSRIVTSLAKSLGFSLQDDVASVVTAYDEHRKNTRTSGRNSRGRPGSGRRKLLEEIAEKWPELGDEKNWPESSLLKGENQDQLLTEIKLLPGWKAYDERRKQRQESEEKAAQHELREIKFRRCINTLETIVLEKNLPLIATPEVIERYRQMVALEDSTLSPPHK